MSHVSLHWKRKESVMKDKHSGSRVCGGCNVCESPGEQNHTYNMVNQIVHVP